MIVIVSSGSCPCPAVVLFCALGCAVVLLFPLEVWWACFPRLTLMTVTPAADDRRAGRHHLNQRFSASCHWISLSIKPFHQQSLLPAGLRPSQ